MSSQCSWSSLILNTLVTQWLVITSVVSLVLPSVFGLVSCWYFLCLFRDHNDSFSFICISCSRCSPGEQSLRCTQHVQCCTGKERPEPPGVWELLTWAQAQSRAGWGFFLTLVCQLLLRMNLTSALKNSKCRSCSQSQASLKHFFRQITSAQRALLSCFVQTT